MERWTEKTSSEEVKKKEIENSWTFSSKIIENTLNFEAFHAC